MKIQFFISSAEESPSSRFITHRKRRIPLSLFSLKIFGQDSKIRTQIGAPLNLPYLFNDIWTLIFRNQPYVVEVIENSV